MYGSVSTQVRRPRENANAVLRTALERDILHRVVELRERLRRDGESYDAFSYADGILIVSALDTNGDLARKVSDLLGQ
jgi:hypothetical protein